MRHERYICPIGQGGFSIERIEDFVIVYDCGSTSSPQMIESCIDRLSLETDHINLLFISHFDKDHVNSLRYLLSNVRVYKAITPAIPNELRWCYGVYTNGASTAILDLLEEYVQEIDMIGDDDVSERTYSSKAWEWVAKSLVTQIDFNKLKSQLQLDGIDLNLVKDADYVELNKETINNVFKRCFGAKGPNAKGLILLSQHCKNVVTEKCFVARCWCWDYPLCGEKATQSSSCLFVGDADLRNRANNSAVQAFLKANRSEKDLQLMQLPHHGSKNNVGNNFENEYMSCYYFLNDRTTMRLQQNKRLFNSLTAQKKLLVAREIYQDLIITATKI